MWSTPMTLPRRLVAVEGRVYVTFGYEAPLTVLDAATGETIQVCEGTSDTDEIVCAGDTVVLRVRNVGGDGKRRRAGHGSGETVVGVDGRDGDILWRHEAKNVVPLTLAFCNGRVVYHNREELVFDDENTYGAHVFTKRARLSPMFRPGKGEVELFADDNSNEPILKPNHQGLEKVPGYSRANPPKWSSRVPLLIRGMVLAGENLFTTGPPDRVPRRICWQRSRASLDPGCRYIPALPATKWQNTSWMKYLFSMV